MSDILLVHDRQASPTARRAVLERAGWSVRTASSVAECLARLRESRPALVLLDVILEGGTGFDACRKIRADHAASELPIVLGCHLYHEPVHAEEAVRAGAQGWFQLPVEPERLIETVAVLTGNGHGVRAA